MTRAKVATSLIALLLAGCQSRPDRGVTVYFDDAPRTPNLVLGPTRDHNILGESFSYRSPWPAADAGYRFEDETFYYEQTLDDQYFHDRSGGSFFRISQSLRAGVLVR